MLLVHYCDAIEIASIKRGIARENLMINLRKLLVVKPAEIDSALDENETTNNDFMQDELVRRAAELKNQDRLAAFQVSIGTRIESREIVRLKELFQTRNMRRPAV